MVASRKPRRMAIEMTAAGIDVENVRPALSPKYTFAAVNTSVIMMPMMRPRTVSSLPMLVRGYLARWKRRIVWNAQAGQDAVADAPALTPPALFRLSPYRWGED